VSRFRPRGVWGFILRRLLLGVVVLILVSILVFLATQALPGDPARAILGRNATPASLAALRRQLHLNRPVIDQYWTWVTGLLHGNLGTSLAAQEPVTTLLRPRLVNSAVLVALAAVLSIPLSIAIGAYAALKREKVFDQTSSSSPWCSSSCSRRPCSTSCPPSARSRRAPGRGTTGWRWSCRSSPW